MNFFCSYTNNIKQHQTYTFGVGTSAEELQGVRLRVWDSDLARRNDLLGEVMLPVDLFADKSGESLALPIRTTAGT
jgi:C2 domain